MFLGEDPPETVSYGDVIHIPAECYQSIENIGDCDLVFLAICTPRFVKEVYKEKD
ncbi:MAG: hypothetical protein N2738_03325 [Thermodesulfovibrionales bacterium]|nr:hypothetical protein [Thermodesulfovibrionales bacterium]